MKRSPDPTNLSDPVRFMAYAMARASYKDMKPRERGGAAKTWTRPFSALQKKPFATHLGTLKILTNI